MPRKKKLLVLSIIVLIIFVGIFILKGCADKKGTDGEKPLDVMEVKETATKKGADFEEQETSSDENTGNREEQTEAADAETAAGETTEKKETTVTSSGSRKAQSSTTSSTTATNSNSQTTQTSSKTTSSSNTASNSGTSTGTQHTHQWVEVKSTVHHDATGHYENVCVKEAWTEEVPVYETVAIEVCNTCGADITGNTSAHIKEHMLKGEGGSRRTEYVQRQTGTKTVVHPAEYEQRWVEDTAAWDETVITYKCSCGATK